MRRRAIILNIIFATFDKIYPDLSKKFSRIVLRISGSGNCDLCEKNKEYISRKEVYKNGNAINLRKRTIADNFTPFHEIKARQTQTAR